MVVLYGCSSCDHCSSDPYEHVRATARILGARQANTRLNFDSKSSKGKILRAVKNFNGPFITPK